MGDVEFHQENISPMEVYCVLGIVAVRSARRIFEFGTYDGATTAYLASSSPNVKVWTLDLPEDQGLLSAQSAQTQTTPRLTGYRYRELPYADRVTQLLGDSRHFDFSRWTQSVDLVIIDGGHSYDIVRSDSANALRMIAPGGVIIWDDYSPVWPDVVRAVDDFAAASHVYPVRIANTGLAIVDPTNTAIHERLD
jgi:predicted O-methyltransferase YrrM